MADLSYIQGAADGTGKALATGEVAQTGAPNAGKAHIEAVFLSDVDDDQLRKRHVAAGTLQAVPQPAVVDLIAALCKVRRIYFVNTDASVRAVTVQDKSGTPIKLLDAALVTPKGVLALDFADVKMTGGIGWGADGPGVNGYVIAYTA